MKILTNDDVSVIEDLKHFNKLDYMVEQGTNEITLADDNTVVDLMYFLAEYYDPKQIDIDCKLNLININH